MSRFYEQAKAICEDIFDRIKKRLDVDSVAKDIESKAKMSSAFRAVYNTPEGYRVLNEIINESGLLNPKTSNHPTALARMDGKRSMALFILNNLSINFDAILKECTKSYEAD